MVLSDDLDPEVISTLSHTSDDLTNVSGADVAALRGQIRAYCDNLISPWDTDTRND